MSNLSFNEEMDITESFREPFLKDVFPGIKENKEISRLLLNRPPEEIILLDADGLSIDSVFAGITKEHIEYLAKKTPREYKKNLLEILQEKEMLQGAFEITESMDKDSNSAANINQTRLKNIIQYIKDNEIAFKF